MGYMEQTSCRFLLVQNEYYNHRGCKFVMNYTYEKKQNFIANGDINFITAMQLFSIRYCKRKKSNYGQHR